MVILNENERETDHLKISTMKTRDRSKYYHLMENIIAQ